MKSVLIIEDDNMLRDGVSEILEMEGYQVLAAADGEQGVKLALNANPHLILCDVGLPTVDGLSVLNVLRKHPNTEVIPFLFLTAQTDVKSLMQLTGLQRDRIILKPFDVDQMLSVVRTQIG